MAQLMPRPLSVGRMRCKRPPAMLPNFRWWFLCDYARSREVPLQYAYSPGLFSTTLRRHGALPARKLKLIPNHECPEAGFEACMSIMWKPLEYPLKSTLEYIQYRFAQGPNGLVPPSIEWMKQWHRFLTCNPKKGVRSLTAHAHVTSHRSTVVSSFNSSLPIYISTIDNKRSSLGK